MSYETHFHGLVNPATGAGRHDGCSLCMPSYVRQNYRMRTYTLTVPSVDNAGRPAAFHLDKVRAGPEEAGFTGWTETASVGYWAGKFEPGTLITLYAPIGTFGVAETLGRIGRDAMPDQEAVQVTVSDSETLLIEA